MTAHGTLKFNQSSNLTKQYFPTVRCSPDFDLFEKKNTFKVQTKALLEVIGPRQGL